MIQVFDTHRLPYRNAVIRAFKLNSDNVTEPAEFYNFTDYIKNNRDISKYAIGTEVYTNASGYICYGTNRQTVSCLGVNESVVVKVSLDGGLSWKIGWTLHGGDDTLTADDLGRLVYADGTVCFDPLQPGDTALRDFVSADDIDPNNRWEEDTIRVNSDSVTLTDWTRVIVLPFSYVPETLNVNGRCRAGQCVDVVNEMSPTGSNQTLTVKLVELNQTFQIPKGVNFRLVGYGDGGFKLVRTGSFPTFVGANVARQTGVYSFSDGQVGDGVGLSVPYGGMNVVVANASNDGGNVGIRDNRGDLIADVRGGRFLVTDNRRPLRPETVTNSVETTVSEGTTASVKIDIAKLLGTPWLPDVLELSVVVESSATLSNKTKVYIGLPNGSENALNTTFVVKLTGSGVPTGNARTLDVILGTDDLKFHPVGTATGTSSDVGDFSAVVASRVVAIGGGLLAHEQLDVTDGN